MDKSKLEELKEAAKVVYKDSAIMQSVVVCQGILESGYLGRAEGSKLAREAYNLFGIKGKGNAGSVMMSTIEYIKGAPVRVMAPFAKYKSVADCFEAHKKLMTRGVSWNRNLYLPVLNANSVYEAFDALVTAGYATDGRYAIKLKNIYDKYLA